MMTFDEIKDLLPYLVSNECNAETLATFETWVNDSPTEQVSEILDLYYQAIKYTTQPSVDFSEITKKIEASIDAAEVITKKVALGRYVIIRRWASVAAILLLITGAGYIFKSELGIVNSITTIEKRYRNNIAPGTNKAILTLGDGSSLALNANNKDGLFKKEAGVTINKLGNALIYNSGDSVTSLQTIYNLITTPRGGQYQLTLPDGSKVWLNAASSLHFPIAFNGKTREVSLTGEAYFEVAKNASKPFIVHVNDMDVKVLGTHFNVMAYTNEATIKTTLLEGSVKLTKGNISQLLVPGNVASYKQQSFAVTEADIEQELAWKNGFFVFNKADIQTIMRQLSRWYDIDITYEGRIPKNVFIGDLSRDASLAEALKILEISGVHFKIDGKTVTVLEK